MGTNWQRFVAEPVTNGSIELVKEIMSLADLLAPGTKSDRARAADYLGGYQKWQDEEAINRRALAMQEGRSTVPEDVAYGWNQFVQVMAPQIPTALVGAATLGRMNKAVAATAAARGTTATKRAMEYGNRLGRSSPYQKMADYVHPSVEPLIRYSDDMVSTGKAAMENQDAIKKTRDWFYNQANRWLETRY